MLHVSSSVAAEWREIEQRLRPFVARRVASAADVDDVLQEVFLRLARGLPELRDQDRMAPWLFSIARNVVIDHHRRVRREPIASGARPDEPVPDPQADDERLLGELSTCVARFITELPDDYREAITLVELEGLSQKEAAERLGLSHSGMKSRVQRGRAALRRLFEDACALELDARRKVIACEPRGCGCGGDDEPS
jgi:RNA polymerase sigma-70 factor (ECF subfamily)